MAERDDAFRDMIAQTLEADKKASTPPGKTKRALTFKRDEKGILWSYDAKTGEKVGRIYEHGDDPKVEKSARIDEIEEIG